MMTRRSWITTTEAAARLDVTPGTVRNMLEDGRLAGERGNQPRRPRWYVRVDNAGRIVNSAGEPIPGQDPGRQSAWSDLDALRQRVADIEAQLSPSIGQPHGSERYQEAALLLSATLERQREALDLQLRANQELSIALTEQGRIIAGLLVPDGVDPEFDSQRR